MSICDRVRGVRFRGISSCVPGKLVDIDGLCRDNMPEPEIEKKLRRLASISGLDRRFIAAEHTLSSDLAFRAGKSLLDGLGWSPDSVDLLLVPTSFPDSVVTPNGYHLHQRLHLSSDCVVIDMNMACSGTSHCLWTAAGLLSRGMVKRALVLVGDIPSKAMPSDDLSSRALFGDAGAALALEYSGDDEVMTFLIGTDSSGADAMQILNSGYRKSEQGSGFIMDGTRVAAYSYTTVPDLLKELASCSGQPLESMEAFYLHQINGQILSMIADAAGIGGSRIPVILGEYGCCVTSTVPLAIVSDYGNLTPNKRHSICICGYGMGFSASAVHMFFDGTMVLPLIHADDL